MKEQRNCIVVDKMHDSIVPMLESLGIKVTYAPQITYSELEHCIAEYEGIIVRSKLSIDSEFLQKATRLKYIARAGAGLDQIDTEYTAQKNILIFNAPEGNRQAVAEHAIAMLLSLLNNLRQADAQVRQGIWDREGNRGYEISGKTIGIIGFGNTGQTFARTLHGFGCNILPNDVMPVAPLYNQPISLVKMEEIFAEADIVSMHIPLTSNTRKLADASFFKKFKKDIWFINTSRGEVVDTVALLESIKNGKIKGAGLDVLENEKLTSYTENDKEIFKKIIQEQKILLSPHVAGWTYESYEKINDVLVQKIKAFYNI